MMSTVHQSDEWDDERPLRDRERAEGYNLLSLIGQGSFGRVFLAQNKEDDSYVAIKFVPLCMPIDPMNDSAAAEYIGSTDDYIMANRASCEMDGHKAVLAVSNSHPDHFVRSAPFALAGYYYFVMDPANDVVHRARLEKIGSIEEYRPLTLAAIIGPCEAGDVCAPYKLTTREALQLGERLLAGLVILHRNGIGHFDIKPSNILGFHQPDEGYRFDAGWKIADMGLAARLCEVSRPRGTFPYRDDCLQPNDPRRDLAAVGRVLWEATSSNTSEEAFDRFLAARTGGRFGRIIRRACGCPQQTRFSTAEEMLAAIRSALGTTGRRKLQAITGALVLTACGITGWEVTRPTYHVQQETATYAVKQHGGNLRLRSANPADKSWCPTIPEGRSWSDTEYWTEMYPNIWDEQGWNPRNSTGRPGHPSKDKKITDNLSMVAVVERLPPKYNRSLDIILLTRDGELLSSELWDDERAADAASARGEGETKSGQTPFNPIKGFILSDGTPPSYPFRRIVDFSLYRHGTPEYGMRLVIEDRDGNYWMSVNRYDTRRWSNWRRLGWFQRAGSLLSSGT
ncbi:hypothetical protein R5W24_000743 [Gemmata sp. JC717]|uniref:hypothetical protein n=1 Tax=Gemmata algarum TaxID=2975278 RepID=UPI0021BB7E1C|nr:hypothetical protein [Gemmata algarum]MDY3551664.1 hypothetical protein [Gemmata algarum]